MTELDPREFCRASPLRGAVLLTYSLDPFFFENVILRDLGEGGAEFVVVFADGGEIDRALEHGATSLRYLGRRYALAPVRLGGAFHPKLYVRFGESSGRVWLGTGNLTRGGWGSNRELGIEWQFGPAHEDSGTWVRATLDWLAANTDGGIGRDMLERILAADWVRSVSPGPSPLLTSADGPLAGQLGVRLAGRRFDEARIITGSTDRTGAFLRWARERLSVTRAVIAVNPASAAFDAEALEGLPMDIGIVPIEGDRPLHAKFYWLDGPDGPAAIVGSPNCSAAAWLVPLSGGGNFESAFVWTAPDREAFRDVLRTFDADAVRPSAVAFGGLPQETDEQDAALPIRIVEAVLAAEGTELQIELSQPADAATAHLLGQEILLSGKGTDWSGPIPATQGVRSTILIRAQVQLPDGGVARTPVHWVSDPAQLAHGRAHRDFSDAFRRFAGASTPGRELLDLVASLGAELLADHDAFHDPLTPRKTKPKKEEGKEGLVRLMSPLDLVRSLREKEDRGPGSGVIGEAVTISFAGIFHALFGEEEPAEVSSGEAHDREVEKEQADRPGALPPAGHDHGDPKGGDDTSSVAGEGAATPADETDHDEGDQLNRAVQRLSRRMERVLAMLEKPGYVERHSAEQVVQGIAYVLVVALRLYREGWIDLDAARSWTDRGIEIALYPDRDVGRDKGLLDLLRERYAEADASRVCESVLGNGVLWVVLCTTVSQLPIRSPADALDRMTLMRTLFERTDLLAVVTPESLKSLLRRYKQADAYVEITERAARFAEALSALEAAISPHEETLIELTGVIPAEQHDLLWSSRGGWAIALETSMTDKVMAHRANRRAHRAVLLKTAGFYVNISKMAGLVPSADEAYDRVVSLLAEASRAE